ncbi:tetratricopeptide repeat protein [Novosphingobium sp. 1949]|uniref:Tetratricopeptide repeat protein n=1 Tax=Novosphingobium organovorum TaxID=2930092 RepID=A0ABT0B9S1_9SPHN|nr:tetratricopeptide repeat protein [Novosphingobium organovorum]MCJ2181689.1 tetratricopeptide repeat protein [Novosphingobium organovorum]
MLAAGLALGASPLAVRSGHGQEDAAPAGLIARARAALAKGDGIAAEMRLRAALDKGAARRDIAAWMGEAYLDQGDTQSARDWLGQGRFSRDTAALGWRAMARVEWTEGDLAAAGRAFDKALAITPDDPELWVDIGRLRYAGGQHTLAIAAADHALALDAHDVPALTFKGELVRDRYGLVGALAWFEQAILIRKDDVPTLLQYAATLGELDRASEAVTVTRRVLELDPGNAQAYYIQAVIAARAGNFELARRLLDRAGDRITDRAGGLLMRGIVELAAGNPATAGEALEALLRMRPDNGRAKDLLARAIYLSGQYRYATLRFAGDVARGDASPYLLTVLARCHEALGERMAAGERLDAAARPRAGVLHLVGAQTPIGQLLARGQDAAAAQLAESALRADPGNYASLARAGDVQLALGHPRDAAERYARAAAIRMPPSLFLRRYQALVAAGEISAARDLVEGTLQQNPTSRVTLRAAAALAIAGGDYRRAEAILAWLRDTGAQRDVQVLSNLALVEAGLGDPQSAQITAMQAYRLQRASPEATQALAFAEAALGRHRGDAQALFDKAAAMAGPTALIAQGRAILAEESRFR